MNWKKAPYLELIKEFKIHQLLAATSEEERLEASGICRKGPHFYIVFDNRRDIARLEQTLEPGHPDNHLIRLEGEPGDFEGIAYDPGHDRFLVLNEAIQIADKVYQPKIEEFDKKFGFVGSRLMDFTFKDRLKGMEGVAILHRNGQDFALALCEGNKCCSGAKGRKPGGGRIQIFQSGKDQWEHRGTIKLPKSVEFEDYASMDIQDGKIAVVSQASSALWLGKFKKRHWDFKDKGRIYQFPKNSQGKTEYCNIEGVAWIDDHRIAVVSDKRKKAEQPKRCRCKDQSVHMFRIPE